MDIIFYGAPHAFSWVSDASHALGGIFVPSVPLAASLVSHVPLAASPVPHKFGAPNFTYHSCRFLFLTE